MKILRFMFLAAAGCLGVASAASIGPVCGSCAGGVYTLTTSVVSIGATQDVFNLFLNVNTDTYTGGGVFIDSVAPKISSSILSVTLLSAPGGIGGWTYMIDQGLGAGGCTNGGTGYICTASTGSGAPVSTDANNAAVSNDWSWQVTIAHGTLLTGTDSAGPSLKVLFTDANGSMAGGILSEPMNPTPNDPVVPEPATYSMIGLGLTGLGLARRKFRNSNA